LNTDRLPLKSDLLYPPVTAIMKFLSLTLIGALAFLASAASTNPEMEHGINGPLD
jgi:hypothetical protein